jgi:hypothetical protein
MIIGRLQLTLPAAKNTFIDTHGRFSLIPKKLLNRAIPIDQLLKTIERFRVCCPSTL